MPGQRGGRFVHDQELGVGDDGAADRDELSARDRQFGNRSVEVQRDVQLLQRASSGSPDGAPVDRPHAAAVKPDSDVLGDRQVREQRQVLVDHLDAEAAALNRVEMRIGVSFDDDPASGVGADDAGDDLDHRRLAGSIAPDEAMDLTLRKVEIDVRKRQNAAEPFRDRLELKEVHDATTHVFRSTGRRIRASTHADLELLGRSRAGRPGESRAPSVSGPAAKAERQRPILTKSPIVSLLIVRIRSTWTTLFLSSTTALPKVGISTPVSIFLPSSTIRASATMP